jgi:hypothetical protein
MKNVLHGILLLLLVGSVNCDLVKGDEVNNSIAFVSVLSSNDFVLAASVLGYSIKKYTPHIPFVILATGDVTDESIAELRTYGIETRRTEKFDTPYAKTHRARKFQYTKIRLWSHTEFSTLVHVDLDTLLLTDVSELFLCGDFCASLRHSDMFNSGVFVFRPDTKVYKDMAAHVSAMESYDGGDQGFFNSYFWQVKYAPMFSGNLTRSDRILRLSAAYNYDVGMYYLRNRALVEPKIMHYTLGPLKPWKWWSYPIFDLNWKWLAMRNEMHLHYAPPNYTCFFLLDAAILCGLLLMQRAMERNAECKRLKLLVGVPSDMERRWMSTIVILIGIVCSFSAVPEQMLPQTAWTLFTINLAVITVVLSTIYSRTRLDQPFGLGPSFVVIVAFTCSIFLAWNLLVLIQVPTTRFLWTVAGSLTWLIAMSLLIDSFLFRANTLKVLRYLPINREE